MMINIQQINAETSPGISEKPGQYVPLDIAFTDETGKNITLKEIISKPAVISLIYYNCAYICPKLLVGLAGTIERLPLKAGRDYTVITISFDEKDTAEIAKNKKRNYIKAINKSFPQGEWKFLTGNIENIKRFTDAVGFSFKREGNDFAHPMGLIILSPDGKITRYLYGTSFLPLDLTMAITEASQGKAVSTVKKALLFCFSYDAKGKKYVFNILKVTGSATIIFAAAFFIYLITTTKKYRRNAK
jgi:protein SCO1/2